MKALTPWRPRRELDTLSRRMDEMFDRLTRERRVRRANSTSEPWKGVIQFLLQAKDKVPASVFEGE